MTTELFQYSHFAAILILMVLIVMLLSKQIDTGTTFAPYRRARLFLVLMYACVIIDLLLSLTVFYAGLDQSRILSVVDITMETPVAVLFCWFMGELFDSTYNYRRTMIRDGIIWLFCTLVSTVSLFIDSSLASDTLFISIIVLWSIFMFSFAIRIWVNYRGAIKRIENYYSDNMHQSTERLRISSFAFVGWGIFCPIAAIMPPSYNTIYVCVGLVVFIFLYTSFVQYHAGFEFTHRASSEKLDDISYRETKEIVARLHEWSDRKGYRIPGVTVEQVARELGVSCAAVTMVINRHYSCSFRDHINALRVRDAQEILVHFPTMDEDDMASMLGYKSSEEMVEGFLKTTGVTPSLWRQGVMSYMVREEK